MKLINEEGLLYSMYSEEAKGRNALEKLEEIKHWLEFEIERAEKYKNIVTNVFDGLEVGFELATQLQDSHIRFCKEILKMIEE